MDWLGLHDRIEEYYRWRREKHPPYPDLHLEWGLFQQLGGLLRHEIGDDPDDADNRLDEVERVLHDLQDQDRRFEDLAHWERWLEAQGGIRPKTPAPDIEALESGFRAGLNLPDDTEMDALLRTVAPLEALPEALRRAVQCQAFARLFATMAEFFTYRDEAEVGRRLFALASLTGGRPSRHWLYRARWERLAGEAGAAMSVLEAGLKHFPDDIELIRTLAEERDRAGDLPGAIELLEGAVARQPEWPDLRYDLARLLGEHQHPEESLLHIGKALELNPRYTRASITRAEVLLEIGESDAAATELETLRERDVATGRVYELLSQIYAEREDGVRAERFGVLAQELLESEADQEFGAG